MAAARRKVSIHATWCHLMNTAIIAKLPEALYGQKDELNKTSHFVDSIAQNELDQLTIAKAN